MLFVRCTTAKETYLVVLYCSVDLCSWVAFHTCYSFCIVFVNHSKPLLRFRDVPTFLPLILRILFGYSTSIWGSMYTRRQSQRNGLLVPLSQELRVCKSALRKQWGKGGTSGSKGPRDIVDPGGSWLQPAGRCPPVQKWHGEKETSIRKIWIQASPELQNELAVAHREMMHHAKVAQHREQDRKRYDQDNVAPRTLKGRTSGMRRWKGAECNNGIRDWGLKQQLWGNERINNSRYKMTAAS
jgi:hypothetical protein